MATGTLPIQPVSGGRDTPNGLTINSFPCTIKQCAYSSVGQSRGLIILWSLVRAQHGLPFLIVKSPLGFGFKRECKLKLRWAID